MNTPVGAFTPAVVLVGPPGAGKTSVAKALSERTGMPMRDTDADIEAMARKPVSDIFTEDGEAHFRELERQAVARALATHHGILALGGGAIMAPETRRALAGHAVVFLDVSMPTGVHRTGLARNRPLMIGVNPRATFKALLDARRPLYQEVATIAISTDHLSVEQVADRIVEALGLGAR